MALKKLQRLRRVGFLRKPDHERAWLYRLRKNAFRVARSVRA
jgi:hypothetical protein